MRPAHLHFLIFKGTTRRTSRRSTCRTTANIDTDVQFGVTGRLLGDLSATTTAAGARTSKRRGNAPLHLHREPGKAKLPRPPIQDKAKTTYMRPDYLEGEVPDARPRWRNDG